MNSNFYTLVSNVASLEDGDAVLIVSGNKALSTTQNANNRPAVDVTVADGTINTPSDEVQKLVLVKAGDYFYFNTGSGYLYAASSTSNYLRTEETPDDNAKAT